MPNPTDQTQDDKDFEQAFADSSAAIKADAAPELDAPEGAAAAAPAPSPAPASAPAASAPAPAPAAPAQPPTVEELQTKLKETEHRERSSANRISEFARKSNDLERQVRELNEKLTKMSAAPAAPAPAAAPAVADEDDVLTGAPDLDKAVQKRVDKLVAPLRDKLASAETRLQAHDDEAAAVKQTLVPISRDAHQRELQKTFTALDEGFTPAWRTEVQTPEFKEWLQARPQRTQDLYVNAMDPADCAEVLDLYYALKGGRPKPTAAPAPAPAADPQSRLRAAVGVPPSRGAARPTTVDPEDFDGAFAAASALIRQERRA